MPASAAASKKEYRSVSTGKSQYRWLKPTPCRVISSVLAFSGAVSSA